MMGGHAEVEFYKRQLKLKLNKAQTTRQLYDLFVEEVEVLKTHLSNNPSQIAKPITIENGYIQQITWHGSDKYNVSVYLSSRVLPHVINELDWRNSKLKVADGYRLILIPCEVQ